MLRPCSCGPGGAAPPWQGRSPLCHASADHGRIRATARSARSQHLRHPTRRRTAARGHAGEKIPHLFAIGRAVTSHCLGRPARRLGIAAPSAVAPCSVCWTESASGCGARPPRAGANATGNIRHAVRYDGRWLPDLPDPRRACSRDRRSRRPHRHLRSSAIAVAWSVGICLSPHSGGLRP